MNSAIADATTLSLRTRFQTRPRRSFTAGFVASALFHLALLIALLNAVPAHRSGGHPPARIRAVIITLAPEPRPVAPPAPVKPPEQLQPLVPVPTPIPAPVRKPKPAAQPKPRPKPAAPTAPPTPPRPLISPEVQEMEDVLGRIHENWLEPPSAVKNFHCRVHIDYAIGGMITAVNIVQDCGSPVLDDSVRRAVWKTQPLPLLRAKLAGGSIDIDFLP